MPHQPRATSFNKVAEQYEKLRPGYPRSFIREIIREVGVPAGEIKAFEIGCGTGKATADFAKALISPHSRNSGLRIKAIDPGENLLEVAKRKFIQSYQPESLDCATNTNFCLSENPRAPTDRADSSKDSRLTTPPPIEFVLSKAEDYQVAPDEEHSYDLVYAAQSFHYVDRQKGLELCHRLLKPNGLLALFWGSRIHLNSPAEQALNQLQAEYLGESHLDWTCNQDRRLLEELNEIEATKLFNQLQLRWCCIKKSFSTPKKSAKSWKTTSHFILMPKEKQQELLEREASVYKDYGGKIEELSGVRVFLGRRR